MGPFIGIWQQPLNAQQQIPCQDDINELRAPLAYDNLFHHDSNLAWATQVINDQALMQFARRTLAFCEKAVALTIHVQRVPSAAGAALGW